MDEAEVKAIWTAVREFIQRLQQDDPDLQRWLVPRSNAAMLLEIYGRRALLLLLKDNPQRNRFSLLQIEQPATAEKIRLVELAWIPAEMTTYSDADLFTLELRLYYRRWRIKDLWPWPLDDRLTLGEMRSIADREGEAAPPALLWLTGALALPLEGEAELDKVEALFVVGMDSRGFSPREVVQALCLWRDYQRKAKPKYRKPGILAGAVEYTFSLLGRYGDEPAEIADYYNVSTRSLLQRFTAIRDELRLTVFDPRYSVQEEPLDILQEIRKAMGISPSSSKRPPLEPPTLPAKGR